MKKLLAAFCLVMLLAGGAFAANVVQLGNGFIYVALDGAADFEWATATFTVGRLKGMLVKEAFPQGLALTSISYYPPATSAVLQIRDGTTTGPIMPTKMKAITGDALVKYFDGTRYFKPSIKNSEQTTPTAALIWFEYANKPVQ